MQLVNGFTLMDYAKKHNLVLPAFNTTDYEMTLAIVKAFDEMGLGGYIQISSNNLKFSSPQIIANMTREVMERENVSTPIGLHLDHGKSFDDVKACIDAGFTSVMVDASELPYKENIKAVKRASEYAHFFNIPVEAELGGIKGKEDDHVSDVNAKTHPEDVLNFVEKTGCDVLAVAVGNVHGLDLSPNLDFPLLEEVAKNSPVPLVLHGGSGIPFDQVRKAKNSNLIKVNYGSDLRKAYIKTFGQSYDQNHNEFNLIAVASAGVDKVIDAAKNIIHEVNEVK
ncbi:class II aldolase [Xylocopilactobacillus apicola]|uniref:Fructose-bisphosphate aldolase n=1 Tax=Xylocopilactobacillus apicola TaxID=2932184 RepID=A0AAU9D604_9LACO|nr:class II aldolase [Xylocopilactobacillus apicola]BDR57710.1 fructose-bisphosphate aldolase [Xylocopilactobacillus apicola]